METIKCKNNYGETVELPKKNFKIRESVYAILKRKNYILTCKSKSDGKIWFPGGGIDLGETHKQALLRECLEETGIQSIEIREKIGDIWNYFYYEPKNWAMHAHLHFYLCNTNTKKVKSNTEIDDEEATDLKWVTIEEIHKEHLSDPNEKIFKIINSLK